MAAEGSNAPARHVLVLERDTIIGLGLAEDLIELGFRVSGPCASLREVAAILRDEIPDGAILDVVLKDGTGLAAARLLRSHGVPVVFFSAGDRRDFVQGEFADVPWIDRPAPIGRLLAALGLKRPGTRQGSGI